LKFLSRSARSGAPFTSGVPKYPTGSWWPKSSDTDRSRVGVAAKLSEPDRAVLFDSPRSTQPSERLWLTSKR
jgi:hypothetical protein